MSKTFYLFFSLVVLTALGHAQQPKWFGNLPQEHNMIIGYGSGETREEAFVKARSEIAASINVKVSSEYDQMQRLHNEEFTNEITNKIKEEVDVQLTGVKSLRTAVMDGQHFVALSFDGRSLNVKIRSRLPQDVKLRSLDLKSPYAHTLFASDLRDTVFSDMGYIPDYDIVWNNGAYRLIINNQEFILSSKDIQKFLITQNSEALSIEIMLHTTSGYKRINKIKQGMYFHLNVKHASSGYLTLLSIDEEGKVSVMYENRYVETEKIDTYPDLDDYEGLMTEVLNNQETAIESYMAILCKSRQRFMQFEEMSEQINTNTDALRFPALYKMIDRCDFASVVLKTRR